MILICDELCSLSLCSLIKSRESDVWILKRDVTVCVIVCVCSRVLLCAALPCTLYPAA